MYIFFIIFTNIEHFFAFINFLNSSFSIFFDLVDAIFLVFCFFLAYKLVCHLFWQTGVLVVFQKHVIQTVFFLLRNEKTVQCIRVNFDIFYTTTGKSRENSKSRTANEILSSHTRAITAYPWTGLVFGRRIYRLLWTFRLFLKTS